MKVIIYFPIHQNMTDTNKDNGGDIALSQDQDKDSITSFGRYTLQNCTD